MATPPAIQQVSLSLGVERGAIAPSTATNQARREKELKIVREYIQQRLGGPLPFDLHARHPPFNICLTNEFASQVKDIHTLLDKALIDIVERWFSDEEAGFPSRMPLEKHEEDLLRWIDGPGSKQIPRFGRRYGMWRTDYLIEKDAAGIEAARVCEINARIPFNGFWVAGLHEEATKLLGAGTKGFNLLNDFETTVETIINCFDRTKPVYHVRSKWPGVDSQPLALEYQRRTGHPMIQTDPKDLQLKEDSESLTGYSLWYNPKEGENGQDSATAAKKYPERVHQCSLELFQEEIAQIDPLMLRQLATCCTNDFRTILLLHDKRILGIVLEELPNLVHRGLFTSDEAARLKAGIADTLLSGTDRISKLYEQAQNDPTIKDGYIIKPARDAACRGILLGRNISQEQWLEHLARATQSIMRPHEDVYIIQKIVDHIWYDIVRHGVDVTEVEKFHLIASAHYINSKLFVYGPWRIGEEVHVGLSAETKGIVMSAVLRPDLPVLESSE